MFFFLLFHFSSTAKTNGGDTYESAEKIKTSIRKLIRKTLTPSKRFRLCSVLCNTIEPEHTREREREGPRPVGFYGSAMFYYNIPFTNRSEGGRVVQCLQCYFPYSNSTEWPSSSQSLILLRRVPVIIRIILSGKNNAAFNTINYFTKHLWNALTVIFLSNEARDLNNVLQRRLFSITIFRVRNVPRYLLYSKRFFFPPRNSFPR